MRGRLLIGLIGLIALVSTSVALDSPHAERNGILCTSCHNILSTSPGILVDNQPHVPADIDDTPANNLCWSCHNDVVAPFKKTHSSLTIDNDYGDWNIECKRCHNPHYRPQEKKYGAQAYLATGVVDAVTGTTLTSNGAGWAPDEFVGRYVGPDMSQAPPDDHSYKIISNTSDTLTVEGTIDLSIANVGDTFAIVYGKLIKDQIFTPNSGWKPVRFFKPTGTNSYADGDTTYDGVCEVCHTQTNHFRNDGLAGDQLHSNMNFPAGTVCVNCHMHDNGFRPMGGGAHTTHVTEPYGPNLQCTACHGSNLPPVLADSQPLATTGVCDNCHSPTGAAIAKNYYSVAGSSKGVEGSWRMVEGEASFCGSCHDSSPGNSAQNGTGDNAPNILGDSSTYGFFINGHGKTSGNYQSLSFQATTDIGNPAAGKMCSDCHELTSAHFNNVTKRLKTGWENDVNNSTCKQCHNPGTDAVADPQWYTNYTDFENSAHSGKKCTECHDVHGASGANPAMTKANKQSLCYQCHTSGGVENNAISGAGLATNIQQAFGLAVTHPLGQMFPFSPTGNISSASTKDYELNCVSCHNVHIVTGKYWDADQNKSPVTRFSDPTALWGATSGQKIGDYAGTGKYQTPHSETFGSTQLPDYATFCLDCHRQTGSNASYPALTHFGIDWTGDPHGLQNAGAPNGYGLCPNWYTCGLVQGRSAGDDHCVSTDQDTCWPTESRGWGDQVYMRRPYDHAERMTGVNFVLSCTNCHEAHGSNVSSMIRSNPNDGTGTVIWNTMCNNCHYYYSDWHAGMSCGDVSCHVNNSIHRMLSKTGAGARGAIDKTLVLDYRFENNLKDSTGTLMHGKWMDNLTGSFAAGKNGQAVVLDGSKNVQVGTENDYWSTDAGRHGTWRVTEMKYNATFEAWVYPTDTGLAKSDYKIFSRHVGYSQGGYEFTLVNSGGVLKPVFYIQADNNSFAEGGAVGVRSAISSIKVPFNTWTHVAATFDTNGPDKSFSDTSVGRIRIYVNGRDVTTSTGSQPGAGETSIFAYSENSPWNESICYAGHWCASEFSIGGFYGWQNAFVGRLDDAKVWNVTKPASYFAAYESQAAPYISSVEAVIGSPVVTIHFSTDVYTDTGMTGSLTTADFVLADSDDGRTIVSVDHAAGSSTAVLTLSAPIDGTNDIGVDSIAAVAGGIYSKYDMAVDSTAVLLSYAASCPTGLVTFNLDEAPGSAYAFDTQGLLSGDVVGGATALTGSAFSGAADGRYVFFSNNDTCMQTSTAMTLEARVKPSGIAAATGSTDYIRRIFDRTNGGAYQMSLWRAMSNSNFAGFTPPDGVVSIALWARLVNSNSGNDWKPVLTDYTLCPITDGHWYRIKAVWDTNKPGGTPGQPFVPADIWIDDQGTDDALADDGNDANDVGQTWAGFVNCTNSAQTYATSNTTRLYTGDSLYYWDGNFAIGANSGNPANNQYNGLIDWIIWKDAVIAAGDVPTISDRSPVDADKGVAADSNLTFTLTDEADGINWTTFSITLTGDRGYSKTYTSASTAVVSRSGNEHGYSVTINPDLDFGFDETITAVVAVSDREGNNLAPPSWSFRTTISPSGAVAYWKFGEGSGQSLADSVGPYACVMGVTDVDTVNDPIWTTSGKRTNALLFDGTNSYAGCGNYPAFDFAPGSKFSLEAWVRFDALGADQVILSKMGDSEADNNFRGWQLAMDSSNNLEFRLVDSLPSGTPKNYVGRTVPSVITSTGVWYHVMVTYNGQTFPNASGNDVSIYVDGVLYSGSVIDSNPASVQTTTNAYPMRVGMRGTGAGASPNPFSGTIDEVVVFNRPLTGPEVLQRFTTP